ncbi:MAG: hypothetical protein IIA45_04525 [Bacteroidetes bacterium]|nr:hypothetical protein [Bacteroidota bacterium]
MPKEEKREAKPSYSPTSLFLKYSVLALFVLTVSFTTLFSANRAEVLNIADHDYVTTNNAIKFLSFSSVKSLFTSKVINNDISTEVYIRGGASTR